jgi:hypothetical protein
MAINAVLMSESGRKTSSTTFVSRMVAVAARQCDHIDNFSKGMLVFLQGLRVENAQPQLS